MKKSKVIVLGAVTGVIIGLPMYYMGKAVKCYVDKVKKRVGSISNINGMSEEEKKVLQEEAIYEAMPILRKMEE